MIARAVAPRPPADPLPSTGPHSPSADLASSLDMSGPPVSPPAAAAFFDLDKTIIAGSSALAFSRPFRRQGLITRRACSAQRLRPAADHAVRRGRRDDGGPAAADHRAVHRLGGRPDPRDRGRDAARDRRAPRLRRGHRSSSPSTGRTATRSWCCRRRGWRSSSRSPRSSAPTAARPPAWRSATGATPGRSSSTSTASGRRRPPATSPPRGGTGLADCRAYSDSITDLPLLEAVGHPTVVNPDRALRRVAAGARLADPDLRRCRSPCARGSGRPTAAAVAGRRAGGGRARRCGLVRVCGRPPLNRWRRSVTVSSLA